MKIIRIYHTRTLVLIAVLIGAAASVALWRALAATTPAEEELRTQITQLEKTVSELSKQLEALIAARGQGSASGDVFTRDLKLGNSGEDVKALQMILNIDTKTALAAEGPGSSGNETTMFGPLTKNAVKRFQETHAAEILDPLGLSAGTGYVGAATRKKLNVIAHTAIAEGKKYGSTAGSGTISQQAPSTMNKKIEVSLGTDELIVMYPSEYAAPRGTKLLLHGGGFTPEGNTIYFGSSYALRGLATNNPDTLPFTVPADISFGKYFIAVENGKGKSNDDTFFIVTNPAVPGPEITEITPAEARYGNTILIRGSGFLPTGNTIRAGYAVLENLPSPDGTTIQFTATPSIPELEAGIKTGMKLEFWVSVENKNGLSKQKTFFFNM